MGRSLRKKKGSGGTGRRRPPAADHTSVDTDVLSDELISLRALLKEDCDLVSENHIKIKLRPHSKDPAYEDSDVLLSIRFFDGYPYKCPKLQIESEQRLAKSDADNLLSLLRDQANLYAAKGQVMILKLVEDAQRFLSEVALHARLLRLACSSKGPLDALTDVASELAKLGIFSDRVADLATESSSLFDESFNQTFEHQAVASRISQFSEAASDTKRQNASPELSSRYLNDFEELKRLGVGGFGLVVLCKNKLDRREYAVKIIPPRGISQSLDGRILREVATFSRLQHPHIVRYYQAWSEIGYAGRFGGATSGSNSLCYSDQGDLIGQDKNAGAYLYIQMEYCPRTLKQTFESSEVDEKLACHIFRQIVEGLAYIHGQRIIHRDLTPANIFFDAHNDIKIGDFGLARFLKLEELEQDVDTAETTGLYLTGSNDYGVYPYKAPEIAKRGLKINEKVDIYSLGFVFFELWHPFSTAMERVIVITSLRDKGEVPSDWAEKFPDQALLLRLMLSSSPEDRPSAAELLKHVAKMESDFVAK